MFYYSVTKYLLKGESDQIFKYGNCKHDFAFVDDSVDCVIRVIQVVLEKKNGEQAFLLPSYVLYNIGVETPEYLLDYITTLQEEQVIIEVLSADSDFNACKEFVGMQPGGLPVIYADNEALERL